MNISITDFWGMGFNPNNNFFTHLLKSIDDNINFVPFGDQTEVLIYSCFGGSHNNADRGKVKKIFYTGENIRPNYNECDYSFTFDFDDYEGKNVRVPLWLTQIDFFNQKGFGNPEFVVPLEQLTDYSKNPCYNKNKDKFTIIINNHLGNKRKEFVQSLAKKKEVHGFGEPFNNWFYGESKKLDKLSEYRFNICFENTNHPGYYTEKLIHAKAAGCIPIYYSEDNVDEDFNTCCMINLKDFESVDILTEKVMEIENHCYLYNELKNQKLFKNDNYPIEFFENMKNQVKKVIYA